MLKKTGSADQSQTTDVPRSIASNVSEIDNLEEVDRHTSGAEE